MLKEKGDGHLAVSLGTAFNVNASYSPLSNVVMISNYNNGFGAYEINKDTINNESVNYFGYGNNHIEFGAGYFNSKLFKNHYIDLIAGYGIGESGTGVRLNLFTDKFIYKAKFQNFFIQSTYGTNLDKDFVVGMGGKLNFLSFYDYKSTTAPKAYSDSTFSSIDKKILFQPFCIFRVNKGIIGYETYFGLAFGNENKYFRYKYFDIGFGVHADIGKFRDYLKNKR